MHLHFVHYCIKMRLDESREIYDCKQNRLRNKSYVLLRTGKVAQFAKIRIEGFHYEKANIENCYYC